MRGLTISRIVSICNGRYCGDMERGENEISSITTDSRKVDLGCLFAALRGQRNDGHDFVEDALSKGAACCLVERETNANPTIVVDSVADALKKIAEFYRGLFDIPVIGVTGSVGKTTTKEMIWHVLSEHFCTLKTEGNFNNELGVPLTLFRLEPEHQAAVIEMGVSDFGEMSRLTSMVRPDIALFTVIGDAHLEFFGDRQGVMRAKGEITQGMPENGVVFINGDDEILSSWDFAKTAKSYGIGTGCDVRAENITEHGKDGVTFDVVSGERRFRLKTYYGMHMVYAALGAAAIGLKLGLSDDEISAGISKYLPEGSRARVLDFEKNTVIDDCYNANPTSTKLALESLSKLSGKKVAILGDMRELGKMSRQLHIKTGEAAAKLNRDMVIAVGKEAEGIYEGAREFGANVRYYADKAELIPELKKIIKSGDTVLVKASRGMYFEDIVAALGKL